MHGTQRSAEAHPTRRVLALVAGLAAITFASVVLLLGGGLLVAPVEIPLRATVQILLNELSRGWLFPDPCAGTGIDPSLCSSRVLIVWQLTVPAVLLALVAGAGLGVSGASLQGVFRNPLADPFLLGIATGGTLGAAVVQVFNVLPAQQDLALPLFAFAGGSLTGMAVLLATRGRSTSTETLLLGGVALSYLLSGVLSVVLLYDPYRTNQVTDWLLGSLGRASWPFDGIAFGLVLVLGLPLTAYGRELNLMQLGPEVAQSGGVDVPRVRTVVILLSSLVTSGVVAFTGVIGFVGLVSPHIVRRWIGTDYRVVVPVSGLVGALFLVTANDAANLAFPRMVFPVGIFTAFAGAPFFLLLLYRSRRSGSLGGSG